MEFLKNERLIAAERNYLTKIFYICNKKYMVTFKNTIKKKVEEHFGFYKENKTKIKKILEDSLELEEHITVTFEGSENKSIIIKRDQIEINEKINEAAELTENASVVKIFLGKRIFLSSLTIQQIEEEKKIFDIEKYEFKNYLKNLKKNSKILIFDPPTSNEETSKVKGYTKSVKDSTNFCGFFNTNSERYTKDDTIYMFYTGHNENDFFKFNDYFNNHFKDISTKTNIVFYFDTCMAFNIILDFIDINYFKSYKIAFCYPKKTFVKAGETLCEGFSGICFESFTGEIVDVNGIVNVPDNEITKLGDNLKNRLKETINCFKIHRLKEKNKEELKKKVKKKKLKEKVKKKDGINKLEKIKNIFKKRLEQDDLKKLEKIFKEKSDDQKKFEKIQNIYKEKLEQDDLQKLKKIFKEKSDDQRKLEKIQNIIKKKLEQDDLEIFEEILKIFEEKLEEKEKMKQDELNKKLNHLIDELNKKLNLKNVNLKNVRLYDFIEKLQNKIPKEYKNKEKYFKNFKICYEYVVPTEIFLKICTCLLKKQHIAKKVFTQSFNKLSFSKFIFQALNLIEVKSEEDFKILYNSKELMTMFFDTFIQSKKKKGGRSSNKSKKKVDNDSLESLINYCIKEMSKNEKKLKNNNEKKEKIIQNLKKYKTIINELKRVIKVKKKEIKVLKYRIDNEKSILYDKSKKLRKIFNLTNSLIEKEKKEQLLQVKKQLDELGTLFKEKKKTLKVLNELDKVYNQFLDNIVVMNFENIKNIGDEIINSKINKKYYTGKIQEIIKDNIDFLNRKGGKERIIYSENVTNKVYLYTPDHYKSALFPNKNLIDISRMMQHKFVNTSNIDLLNKKNTNSKRSKKKKKRKKNR